MSFGTQILPFLMYWLFLFIALYMVAEYGQYYIYESPLPYNGPKALGGGFILALVLMWSRTSFDTMLTSEIGTTVLQGIVWFLVFTFVLRFHPLHGAVLGVLIMLIVPGLASMAVDSLSRPVVTDRPTLSRPSKPLRTAIGPGMGGPPPASKAAPDAAKPAPAE